MVLTWNSLGSQTLECICTSGCAQIKRHVWQSLGQNSWARPGRKHNHFPCLFLFQHVKREASESEPSRGFGVFCNRIRHLSEDWKLSTAIHCVAAKPAALLGTKTPEFQGPFTNPCKEGTKILCREMNSVSAAQL